MPKTSQVKNLYVNKGSLCIDSRNAQMLLSPIKIVMQNVFHPSKAPKSAWRLAISGAFGQWVVRVSGICVRC
jgi:hypothetical protein